MIHKKEVIKIIQISDTHLFKSEQLLFGINTNLAFKNILEHLKIDSIDADAIFLTGDLSQDDSIESYEFIADSLSNIHKQIFWIPGNHDSIPRMHTVFDKMINFIRTNTFSTPLRDFIFLNTQCNGKGYGYLSKSDLDLIRVETSKKSIKPIAIVMHHHPVEVKTPLVDDFILENKDEFIQTIQNSNTDLIICGHVHNDYSLKCDNIHIETSPATCFQFKKGASLLEIEHNIGYKVYYFLSDNYVAESKFWIN